MLFTGKDFKRETIQLLGGFRIFLQESVVLESKAL